MKFILSERAGYQTHWSKASILKVIIMFHTQVMQSISY